MNEQKNKWRSKRMYKIWADWCDRTTFHGFNELQYWTGSLGKAIFWSFMIVAAFGATAYGITQIVLEYYENPTVIRVERWEKSSMELPDVIVCSPAGLNASALRADGASETLINALLYSIVDSTVLVTIYEQSRRKDFGSWRQELVEFETRNNISSSSFAFIWRYRIRCEEFVLGCRSFDNDLQYFGCYRLRNLGVAVVLRTAFPHFGKIVPSLKRGAAIQLIPAGFPYNYYKLTIPSKSLASVGLRWKEVRLRPHSKQPCTMFRSMSQESRQRNTDAFCFSNTWNDVFIEHCGCNSPTFPNKTDVPNCSLFKYLDCFLLNHTNYRRIMDKTIRLQKACAPICNQVSFEPLMSTMNLDPEVLDEFVNPDIRFKEGSVSIVEIFYRSLSKMVYQEVDLFTTDTFISNIGGQIGLWCGCSVLTVVQALVYVLKCGGVGASAVEEESRRSAAQMKASSVHFFAGIRGEARLDPPGMRRVASWAAFRRHHHHAEATHV